MQVCIRSIGSYVPENRVTNDQLAEKVDTSDEWIRSHTGIGARHIISDDQTTSDLAVEAAKIALEAAGMKPEDVGMILVATASPDYPGFPSTACVVQHKIGAMQAAAVDIAAGCTGFVYGLEMSRALVAAGSFKSVLLIGVESLTRITNWQDRNSCVLFGDGAGAVVITPSDNDSAIIDSLLKADGSGGEHLIRKAGGATYPFDHPQVTVEDTYIAMNGRQVYNFAVRVNTEMISELLKRNNLTVDDISWIVPHQANIRIIQAAAGRLKIPMDKFYLNIEEYANTSAASIPLALDEMIKKGVLKRGDLVLLVGFGAGLTYGGNLVRW